MNHLSTRMAKTAMRWWRDLAPAHRRRAALGAISAILLTAAVTLIVVGVGGQQRPPSPALAVQKPVPGTSKLVSRPAPTPSRPPTIGASRSTPLTSAMQISIPAIGVQANVMDLGLNADHTVEVPPLDQVKVAGWYKYSPLPGDIGPSVILGHIDSAVAGRGVFFELGALKPGDKITVLRPDHRIAEFTVRRVAEFAKSEFPTQQIYGNTNDAQLRLITCGGRFDNAARSYVDNIVAFASLTSIHR